MDNIVGIWDSTWPKQGVKSPVEILEQSDLSKFHNSDEVIKYLYSGHRIIAKRSLLSSSLTGELIGVPEILTDGDFIWSSEYTYYVKLGFIKVDESLAAHAEERGYIMVSRTEVDLEKLNELLQKAGFPIIESLR
jgi:hypothetical protein